MQNSKKKILIADDDQAILDAMTLMLEDEGYGVATTIDGHSVQNMHEDLPDLLLLDIWMSGMNGRDICKHLKSQKLTKHMPIIIVSANKDTKKIALECGADDFIAKPFQMKVLLEKVAKYIS
jgi:DNA-binding response OmpR family regulator